MTKNNEQIIINGIDVRKCVNRRWDNSQKIHLCYDSDTPLTSWGWCENNPNCYYKQLKRKEQECEELKEENFELKEEVSIDRALFEEIDQLKKENEELKQFLSKEPLALQTGYADYKKRSEVFFEMINQYKQTLEEIRELLLRTGTDSQEHCVNTKSVILQKINEVIDD